MIHNSAQRQKYWGCEALEYRRLLTVSVAVDNTNLVLTGTADGAVQISATDTTGTFDVYDAGTLVTTASGITGMIKVKLDDAAGSPDNSLAIDLGAAAVDRVMVDLGDGENLFTLSGGTIDNSVLYKGGSGADNVTISATTTIGRNVYANLKDGDNTFELAGTVQRGLFVEAGNGNDNVTIAAGATVGRGASINVGSGDNQVMLAGTINGGVMVRGGDGVDNLQILSGAQIGGSVYAALGSGDNVLTSAGTIDGSLNYDGRDGNDTVTITSDALVGRSVHVRMGAGDNTFTHNGDIANNLFVTSKNENDTATVADTAIVGGKTTIALGQQRDFGFGHGRDPGQHHPFGGPGHGGSMPGAAAMWHADTGLSSAQVRGSRRR
jgi:hypothetical protein